LTTQYQRAAIEAPDGPVLVLSGPGSGKTRVLTHRIAWLISEKNIPPESIMAVTFTNKAANEMKERLEKLVGMSIKKLWCGTFHSICLRLLATNCNLTGYKPGFTIYDDRDQIQLIKRIIEKLGYEKMNAKDIKNICNRISEFKILMKTTHDVFAGAKDQESRMIADIFYEYQTQLLENNALDFDDIICQAVRLLENNPPLRKRIQEKFEYVLVDEYQDINHSQYVFTKLIAEPQNNIFVVGDPNQSIYKFRHADITNILNFESDFPNATILPLEQNFRSVGNIVRAANEVIKNNKKQLIKNLWTENPSGNLIALYEAGNDVDEAIFVADIIQQRANNGASYDDFAVLSRTTFQSRVLEDIFIRYKIPYSIIGGLSFYERKEIKDILAYLRVIVNPNDSVALMRIINTPRRNIGETTVSKLLELSKEQEISLFEAIEAMVNGAFKTSAKCKDGARTFCQMITELRESNLTLPELLKEVLTRSGYLDMLEQEYINGNAEQKEQTFSRKENIGELQGIIADFWRDNIDSTLIEFLQEMSILTDADREDKEAIGPRVSIMTIHAAKGLEFNTVFVVGLEEDLLPHVLSVMEGDIEEERRLLYVAITRAKNDLYISYAKMRNVFGETKIQLPSRFLKELPKDIYEYV
jgi:DNA helicase-2/ATP-dependent DNA helicase PcrA